MRLRVLGRILAAQSLSSMGTSISSVALAVMVFQLTGSVLQMGGILAASTFPLVITSFIGGALLDRFSARNVMVLADLVRAGLIAALPFLARETVGLVYLVAALMGIFSALFNPGQIKLVGELTARERLVQINSYLSVSRDGSELVGYLLGGVLVSLIGYTLTFALDAASYVLSALLLVGLPRPQRVVERAASLGDLIAEAPVVLGRLWREPGLRTNLLLAIFPLMLIMTNVPNMYGLALEVFDRGAAGVAALEVVTASGLILGGLAVSRMSLRGDKNRYVYTALLAMGVCFIGVSLSRWFWLSVALIGLAGLANIGLLVPSVTMFQEVPWAESRGRLIALRAGFGQLGVTTGLLLGGVLGAAVGITRLFLVAGLGGIVLGSAIYLPYRLGLSPRRFGLKPRRLGQMPGARRPRPSSGARRVAADGMVTGDAAAAQGGTAACRQTTAAQGETAALGETVVAEGETVVTAGGPAGLDLPASPALEEEEA